MHFKQGMFRQRQSEGTATGMIHSGNAAALESMRKQTPSSPAVHFLLRVRKEGREYYGFRELCQGPTLGWAALSMFLGGQRCSRHRTSSVSPFLEWTGTYWMLTLSYIPINNTKLRKQRHATGRNGGTNLYFQGSWSGWLKSSYSVPPLFKVWGVKSKSK